MSIPQVQYQLSGRPTLLAGSDWAFLNGRTIVTACRPVTLARFSYPLDVSDPRVVGGNLIFSMSSRRDAFLGHEPVSPLLCAPAHEHRGFRECAKIETSGVG